MKDAIPDHAQDFTFTTTGGLDAGEAAFFTRNGDIWSIQRDGTGLTQLTSGPQVDFGAEASPDGTRIVFSSRPTPFDSTDDIWVMNADGTGRTQLTSDPGPDFEPTWSPDGSKIAWMAGRSDEWEVYAMNADGSGATNLTSTPGGDGAPDWSPDGSKIAFASHRIPESPGVYAMNANGTNQVRLASGGAPDWSPDGSKIAYGVSTLCPPPADACAYIRSPISVMNADGTGQTTLIGGRGDNSNYFNPDWSPEGGRIVFEHQGTGLKTMNPDGTGVAALTSSPGDERPSWDALPGTSFTLDDDSDPTHSSARTFSDVPAGTYSVIESVPPGWAQTSATCDDGSSPSSIDLAAGETVTCTFVNEQRGTLVVRKEATPQDPQNFSFGVTGGLTPAGFELDDDGDEGNGLASTRTFTDVPVGQYSITESVPVGWYQADARCDNGDDPQQVDVGGGETVTCTFVNSRGYVRPELATTLRLPLVPAFQQCSGGAQNRTHGPPIHVPSCHPPRQVSPRVTIGTPDVNGRAANSTGLARIRLVPGDPIAPGNQADVSISVNVTDVRDQPGFADYVGQLQGWVVVQITDRGSNNSLSNTTSATTQDFPLPATVSCAATSDTTIGSTCFAATTANAIVPGSVKEGDRAVWDFDQVVVRDAGADGNVVTSADNVPFMVQGWYNP